MQPTSTGDGPRVIDLEGATNFRDLGGYATAEGRRVRRGMVYRANTLAALTPVDIERIEELGIASLIDLRRRRAPVGWQPDHVYESPKPDTSSATRIILAYSDSADGMRAGMRHFYTTIPDAYHAEFAAFLHRLAADDRPMLIHCTAGKDRTGVASAILLALLGVPRATIVEDYALTGRLLPKGRTHAPMGRRRRRSARYRPRRMPR